MTVKSVVIFSLFAGLLFMSAPVSAQEAVPAGLLTEVCLPYANRAQTFERSIRAARDLEFRRPVNDTAPLGISALSVLLGAIGLAGLPRAMTPIMLDRRVRFRSMKSSPTPIRRCATTWSSSIRVARRWICPALRWWTSPAQTAS